MDLEKDKKILSVRFEMLLVKLALQPVVCSQRKQIIFPVLFTAISVSRDVGQFFSHTPGLTEDNRRDSTPYSYIAEASKASDLTYCHLDS